MDYDFIANHTSMRQIAEQFGFEIQRGGVILCPFHPDKNPSLKLYPHNYYCFACGKGGDVINFVASLKNIPNREAAALLAGGGTNFTAAEYHKRRKERQKAEKFAVWERDAFEALLLYRDILRLWKSEFTYPHRLYIKALCEENHIEYLLDIFTTGNAEDKILYYADESNRRRIDEYIGIAGDIG